MSRSPQSLRWLSARPSGDRGPLRFPGWHSAVEGLGDLQAAIDVLPKAKATLSKLSEQNRFALAFRTHNAKTAVGRKKKIEAFVTMLKRGETIYPQRKK